LDRKLDILGIALALAGLLTFLSLISSNNSSVTGGWVFLLRQAFGIGLYPATLGLMGVGVWLVLRDFEHVPQFAIERVAGFILLLWNLLAWAHLIWIFAVDANALELAAAGQGGGYAGGAVLQLLLAALGFGGAVISLLAWFVIALGMTLDVTIGEMAQRLGPYLNQLLELTREALANLSARLRHQPPPYPECSLHRPGGLPVTAVPGGACQAGPGLFPGPHWTTPDLGAAAPRKSPGSGRRKQLR
jgi:S-DNA-T family DNA segregation ATPase FtsK/SpoIIIE